MTIDTFIIIIVLFTASDFTSITSHIHKWVLFLLWLHVFIITWVISLLVSSSTLGTYRSGEFIFQCRIFLPFHTVHGVLKYWSIWVCHCLLQWNHVLSELSTMTCPSWVTLRGLAHSFIELGAGAVAVRHWSDCEEIPHVQWQRSTSKTVEGGKIAFRIKPHTHQSCS